MTLALRCILAGIVLATVVDMLLPERIFAAFLAFVVGMAGGLAVSWFCWPWEGGPE